MIKGGVETDMVKLWPKLSYSISQDNATCSDKNIPDRWRWGWKWILKIIPLSNIFKKPNSSGKLVVQLYFLCKNRQTDLDFGLLLGSL